MVTVRIASPHFWPLRTLAQSQSTSCTQCGSPCWPIQRATGRYTATRETITGPTAPFCTAQTRSRREHANRHASVTGRVGGDASDCMMSRCDNRKIGPWSYAGRPDPRQQRWGPITRGLQSPRCAVNCNASLLEHRRGWRTNVRSRTKAWAHYHSRPYRRILAQRARKHNRPVASKCW